jgi:hypothetical protein
MNDAIEIAAAAPRLGVSERAYKRKLSDGVWPGRMVCGRWKVTEADIQKALDICYRPAKTDIAPPPPSTGLSSRSTLLKGIAS